MIQEAVDLLRQLAAGRPDFFNAGLASSFNCLSSRLSHLGHERALEVDQEAVDLCRQLAASRPGSSMQILHHRSVASLPV